MAINTSPIAIHDDNTWKDIYEWAKALRGGVGGVAKHACTELAVAAIKKAIDGIHDYQIENQVDGMLRYKKEGDEWRKFSRTGRCNVAIVYNFVGRTGETTKLTYPAMARAINGLVEVVILNPKTGMTMKTIHTKLKARQLTANEWAVEGWPEFNMGR